MIKVAVLTVSDSCSTQSREDVSGQSILGLLASDKFEICEYKIVADEHEDITRALKRFTDEIEADIVLTTGGTGLGPRDVTPEATIAVCDRLVPGISELMRLEGLKKTKNATLSRGISAVRSHTLIINLPGSPKAVRESLETIMDILEHAVAMLGGAGH